MPLSRLTLPKHKQDDIRADIGVDDRLGTPEKFNSDAIIPTYEVGHSGEDQVLKVGYVHQQTDIAGIASNNYLLWGPTSFLNPGYLIPEKCNPTERIFCSIPWGLMRVYFTVAGRAAMDAASCPHTWKLIFQPQAPNGGGFAVAEWEWRVQALANQPAYCDGYIQSHGASSGGMNNYSRRGEHPAHSPRWYDRNNLVMHNNCQGDWFLEVAIDTRYVAVFPAGTLADIWLYYEIHKTNLSWPTI